MKTPIFLKKIMVILVISLFICLSLFSEKISSKPEILKEEINRYIIDSCKKITIKNTEDKPYLPTGGQYIGPFIVGKITANFLNGSGWVKRSGRSLLFEFGPYGDGYVKFQKSFFWKAPLTFCSNTSGRLLGRRIYTAIKYFFGNVKYIDDRAIVEGWCILTEFFIDHLIFYKDLSLMPEDDAYVNVQYPTENYGTSEFLDVSVINYVEEARSFLKFNISSIPKNAFIHKALLSLYYCSWEGTTELEVGVYQVNNYWNENTINWDNQPEFSLNCEYLWKIPPANPIRVEYWDITDLARDWFAGEVSNNGIVIKFCYSNFEEITKRVFNSKECNNNENIPLLIINYNNPPNKPAKPSGLSLLKTGTTYSYSTNTIDTDGDRVYFWFDWGDETNSGWIGPYDYYYPASASHNWNKEGTYQIKVKAKDTFGSESDWSNPFNVTVTQ